MAEVKIYESQNPYYYVVRGEKREGFCCAASAIWCEHILKGKAPKESKPDEKVVGPLHAWYSRNYKGAGDGEDEKNLINNGNILNARIIGNNINRVRAFGIMKSTPGVYHFSNQYHSMAAKTGDPWLFYDINTGLFSYPNNNEWESGISSRYHESDGWLVIQVTKA